MTAALRLYSDDSDAPPQMTLRAAFVTYKLPEIDGRRADATLRNYRTAIAHWETFCRQRASTMSTRAQKCPPAAVQAHDSGPAEGDDVYRISDADLDAFGRWLRVHRPAGPALSVDVVAKQWRSIRSVLRKIGPRESGAPRAVGLIDRVPAMDSVADLDGYGDESVFDGATDVSVDQLGAIYDACSIATWPPAASPPAPVQWRGYVVLGSLLGMRVEQLVAAEGAWWLLSPRSPAKGSTRRHEPGWLCFVPEKTKRSKRARLIVPLPPCVRLHVEPLLRGGRVRLFDFGGRGNHSCRGQWEAIVAQAGCPHIQRRDLRDAANQLWGAIDRDLGRWVCGHAARDVNERHYTRIEPDLIEAIPRLELPPQFARPPEGTHQPYLF